MSPARQKILLATVVLATLAGALAWRHFFWQQTSLAATRLHVDLAAPDAVIVSSKLSQLPQDLLRVPVLRDVLTEDIAFYYEQHEDRLGLKGSLKRIAWEHKLGWPDRLLQMVLDEPAEIAFWRDGNGALRHYALAMRRGTLARVLQEFAAVALKDRQLTRLQDAGGHGLDFPVYALQINPRRTLILAVRGDRIVVLSDAGMLLDGEGRFVAAARDAVSTWLRAEGALTHRYRIVGGAAHTVAVGTRALALGYDAFFPGIEALRFDFRGDAWATRLLLKRSALPPQVLGDADIWKSAPAQPAACVLLPVDAQMPQKVLRDAAVAPEGSSALACWYPHSTLYAPLFVAKLAKPAAEQDAAFTALAKWALRKPDFSNGQDTDDTLARDPAPQPKLAASVAQNHAGVIQKWRAEGAEPAASRKHVTALLAAPTLAASGSIGVFSPDAALVDLAVDTIARKYPGVADQLPETGVTLAVVTPRMLADMLEREANAAVPKSDEAALSAALRTHLAPRMKALAKYPAYRAVLSADAAAGDGWQPVTWEALK